MKPKALILDAPGINCDEETYFAIEIAGGLPEYVMLSDIEKNPDIILKYKMLIMPGGFSYGDYISAGKIISLILKKKLKDTLIEFIDKTNLLLGICNGFQIMVKANILPGEPYFSKQKVSLIQNDSKKFEDRWVNLEVNKNSNCIFTKDIEKLYLPVAHGEGKFVTDNKVLNLLKEKNLVVLRYKIPDGKNSYPYNPNGSIDNIAGICDSTGRIFGLMPHPERYLIKEEHPLWTKGEYFEPTGKKIFKNAIEYLKQT